MDFFFGGITKRVKMCKRVVLVANVVNFYGEQRMVYDGIQ
jgi:hypothetical protein